MREADSKISGRRIAPTLKGMGEGLRRSAEGREAIATRSVETKPSRSRKRFGQIKEKSITRECIELIRDVLILAALSEEEPRQHTEINLFICSYRA
jgi:hypothetical protein